MWLGKIEWKSLPDFYSPLNMEDITDVGYAHSKRVCKDFKIKHSAEYHHFYVSGDIKFVSWCLWGLKNMCLKSYELDLSKFPLGLGLCWQAALKSEIRSFHWYSYVVNGRKKIRGGMFHSVYQYTKPNNKYMKDHDKYIAASYLQYWDANKLYGWEMSQTHPVK